MKKLLILSTALTGVAFAAKADVTVMSWGGAYTVSQVEAYHKPFTAATGTAIVSVDSENPAPAIKAMVEAGNVTVDVGDVEYADAIRLCDEGLLEPIDAASLPAGADGTPAADDFLPGAVTECAVSTIVFSTVYAYDTTKFPVGPTTIADFFDLEKFPGKRGMRKGAKANLEMALMADGVPAADVYATLETPEGQDRAFAMLDKIKAETIWWEAGAQPPQLLADGEVALTTAYNGRIFNAAVAEGKPFATVWDGQVTNTICSSSPRARQTRTQRLNSSSSRPRPRHLLIRQSGSATDLRANRRVLLLACSMMAKPKWHRLCQHRLPT